MEPLTALIFGRILFNIFISDLGTKSRSMLMKFADDTWWGGVINTEKDHTRRTG